MEAVQKSYEEMLDLFARGATPAQILAFRPSQEAQQRIQYLLVQNKAGALTAEEAAELERFGELEHLMQLVKARAHLKGLSGTCFQTVSRLRSREAERR